MAHDSLFSVDEASYYAPLRAVFAKQNLFTGDPWLAAVPCLAPNLTLVLAVAASPTESKTFPGGSNDTRAELIALPVPDGEHGVAAIAIKVMQRPPIRPYRYYNLINLGDSTIRAALERVLHDGHLPVVVFDATSGELVGTNAFPVHTAFKLALETVLLRAPVETFSSDEWVTIHRMITEWFETDGDRFWANVDAVRDAERDSTTWRGV